MKKNLFTAVLCAWLAGLIVIVSAGPAAAHILNEKSLFPDIEAVEARFDIVMLAAAGVIPQTAVFEPEGELTRRDLAAWAALTQGLGKGGENPDVDALAEAALQAGLVSSLEGSATYEEINQALFNGALTIDPRQQSLTRAEAASFIAGHLQSSDGAALMEKLGVEAGPTGPVQSVTAEEGSHHGTYVFRIGETELPMDSHGRVANGPTDLLQWEGLHVNRSLIRDVEGERMLVFLQAGESDNEAEANESDEQAAEEEPSLEGLLPDSSGQTEDAENDPGAGSPPYLLYGLGALAVILAVLLFSRRRGS